MERNEMTSLAAYNLWANQRLYAVAGGLSDADYRADRGAFFGSVHATLNHILVADRIWLRRITGEGPMPSALDAILHDRFDDLAQARRAEDDRIIATIARLAPEDLAGELTYANLAGQQYNDPISTVLMHVFNHQTHHRGQVHALLTGLGQMVPSLDLIAFLRGRPAATAGALS